MKPKLTGTPGEPHTTADRASPPEPAQKAESPAAVVRHSTVNPVVECQTVEEALDLANQRNRAVFTPHGWVCPSIIREKLRAA